MRDGEGRIPQACYEHPLAGASSKRPRPVDRAVARCPPCGPRQLRYRRRASVAAPVHLYGPRPIAAHGFRPGTGAVWQGRRRYQVNGRSQRGERLRRHSGRGESTSLVPTMIARRNISSGLPPVRTGANSCRRYLCGLGTSSKACVMPVFVHLGKLRRFLATIAAAFHRVAALSWGVPARFNDVRKEARHILTPIGCTGPRAFAKSPRLYVLSTGI